MSSGCERNFTAESCKASMTYTMEAVNNTTWEDKNISVLSSSTQEACKAACLQDCNCDAAQFKQGECKKQSLPLRFGRLLESDPNIAFIKGVDYNILEEEAILEEWAYDCFECGELGKLVGAEKVDKKQLERITKVALWCILYEPSLRPSIKKVLQMLEETMDIPDPPNRSVASSVWSKE
ncbi:hypothetical protein CMV_015152 [Castanea mollissima]|uniref:Apple domain-containing protein n=1 Tax=Castanea mollissima TaxID=60419 RepID=A0A8J4R272_9ROSI|nr:hypothetical protein CMV_015152 [Castanea mollissima]